MTDGGHHRIPSYGHLRPLGLHRLVNTGSLLTLRAGLLVPPRFVFSLLRIDRRIRFFFIFFFSEKGGGGNFNHWKDKR